MQGCNSCVRTAKTIGYLLCQKQQLDEFALQGGSPCLTAAKARQMVTEVYHARIQLGTAKDAQSVISAAVAGDERLATLSREYMTRLDEHVQFLEADMYAAWGSDKRVILEFENRELSYRGLIRQVAAQCSVDVTFPEHWSG